MAKMRLKTRPGGFPTGAVLLGAGIVFGALVRFLHLDHLNIPLCTFRAVTGYPCMSCGSTRALGHLARFDFIAAFRMQPGATVAALMLVLWGVADLALLPRKRSLRLEVSWPESRTVGVVVAVLVLLNWIYLIATMR
jgi:hypothetical protein